MAFSNILAGEIIKKSSPLLLPMSLTMISTGMLNSIGFEKQTFFYYFIGAAIMLLCIIALPAVCGIYAYVIGLGASFLSNAVCNLFFLHKQCPFFIKRGGQVRIESILKPILFILPISIFGQFSNALLRNYFGQLFAISFTALIIFSITILLYSLFKIISLKTFLQKIFPFFHF